ncbi:hypothetical protein [Sediminitomix flava]|uniref:Uncharacterized protein n=1 Tax=Sediminitomix flava TaxID=379075 RepID=A0A315ZD96_SEDFL|nr:hypothetical protein [Sediminitomix flava]PWJ42828.1 hypothetical protein BC781_102374 [Sediminitomix flava]
MRISNLSIVFFLLTLISCDLNDPVPSSDVRPNTTYFPLVDGQYRVFYVEDTLTVENEKDSTSVYFLREEYSDGGFIGGDTLFYVTRYSRTPEVASWTQLPARWVVRKSPTKIEVQEYGINYIKLVEPLRFEKQWNGNAMNAFPDEYYTVIEHGQAYSIDTLNFPFTVKVRHGLFRNNAAIGIDSVFEQYAEGVGLIRKVNVQQSENIINTFVFSFKDSVILNPFVDYKDQEVITNSRQLFFEQYKTDQLPNPFYGLEDFERDDEMVYNPLYNVSDDSIINWFIKYQPFAASSSDDWEYPYTENSDTLVATQVAYPYPNFGDSTRNGRHFVQELVEYGIDSK